MDQPYPPALRVSLLGAPAITRSGEALKIPRRQVRALLFRLAAEDKALNRSSLCELFWAGLPESSARQNLSRLLVYLSRAFPDIPLLYANEIQIQLNPEFVAVDTRLFEQHWGQWLVRQAVSPLQQAASLYRGPFLDGFYLADNPDFENWVQEQAAYWEQRYLKILETLLEAAAVQGDYPAAAAYARQMLAVNDLAEDVHRRLMELYAACGDWNAALLQYEHCTTILERELGIRPVPETQAAYQAVLARRLPGELVASELREWVVLPGLAAPLIGRQDAYAALEARLADVRRGSGSLVLLSGEPGIGKSRLMREFASQPRLRTRVLLGSALRECCAIPYQPLIQALRPGLGSRSLLDGIAPAWLAEASRLFPELTGIKNLPGLPVLLNPEIARSRLFEALLRLLLAQAEGGWTVVLCLDDLQWADATSLDWLVYAASRIRGQRILLLGSYRSNEREPLARALASLQRLPNFHEIQLSGLTVAEITRLVGYLPGQVSLPPEQAAALFQLTGGNPFFLLETLRMLWEDGQDAGLTLKADRLPVPDTVQQAVTARLQNLRPQVRQVLEAACVLGSSFSFDQLLLTSGRQEMETLDGLDELVAHQFLVETPNGYAFCHAIIREAVFTSLSNWRRKKLHQRAGYALEKLHSENWSLLAWFFEQAGLFSRAAHYARLAGQAARQVFAHQEARAYFDHALELLQREEPGLQGQEDLHASWRQQIELLYQRGWALRLLGEMQAYTHDLEQVACLALQLNDPHALGHLRWQQAYNHRWFCRYAEARQAAGQGLLLSRQCDSQRLEALCQRELGLADRECGAYDHARLHLQAALALFQALDGQTSYTVHTLGNLSTLELRAGCLESAHDCALQALAICDRAGLAYERRLPLGDLGAVAAAAGDYLAARQALQESLEIARTIADCTQEIFCLGQLGWLYLHTGDPAAACQALGEALDHAEKIDSRSEQSWLQLGLARSRAALGDGPQAKRHAEMARDIAAELGRQPEEHAASAFLQQLGNPTRA